MDSDLVVLSEQAEREIIAYMRSGAREAALQAIHGIISNYPLYDAQFYLTPASAIDANEATVQYDEAMAEFESAKDADERARELAELVLLPAVYKLFAQGRSVSVPSTLVPSRTYSITPAWRTIQVREGGKYCATLCAQPESDGEFSLLPMWDWLAFQYLQLTCNEREWLCAANVLSRSHSTGGWRRFPRQRATRRTLRLVSPPSDPQCLLDE